MARRTAIAAATILLFGVVTVYFSYPSEEVFDRFYYGRDSEDFLSETPDPVFSALEPQTSLIAIVSVLDSSSSESKYRTAMNSMKCYAIRNNYTYLVVNGDEHNKTCTHKDITFQRHCIIAHLLEAFEWIVFVDADIGVVNENVRLEHFTRPDADLIFYDRFFNHEIMAGSYFVKKSNFSVDFLHRWADYEFRLPGGLHGRDQGAIHMLMVELFAPASALRPRCEWLWRNSSDYGTLSRFTVCCREVLQAANFSNVHVYEKGTGWARDGWLTNSHWNPDVDFMFHARKEADKIRYKPADIGKLTGLEYFPWFDTLSSPSSNPGHTIEISSPRNR
ncbi:hypothetical protein Q1695_010262 [Nippostrongylus brasiliensis]|nr:hypothetical protein Q1695_010262 [Nippostrongylus brasiliensis]